MIELKRCITTLIRWNKKRSSSGSPECYENLRPRNKTVFSFSFIKASKPLLYNGKYQTFVHKVDAQTAAVC